MNEKTGTMGQSKMQKKGQNLVEYALIVAIVISALMAMSTYVFRAVQGTQQMIQKEYQQ